VTGERLEIPSLKPNILYGTATNEEKMKAAILVFAEAAKFDEVVDSLKKIGGVKDAFAVAGRADVAVLAEVADLKELSDLALKIFGTPGVTATETLIEVQRGDER